MVTIAMLTGPNGLLNKATEAKIENDRGEIQDRAETEVLASIETNGKINWGDLKENLKSNFGEKTDITDKGEGKGLTFTVEKNKRNYEVDIDEKGKVTVTPEGETSGGGSSSSTEPSEEPTWEPEKMKPGETASTTEKNNYKDMNDDEATIPKDFKISEEDYEIETGLVVEAPDGSEFVWVPVETAITANEADGNENKAMAVKDPTDGNNYRGILYDFSGTTSSVMEGCTTTAFTNTSSDTSYREPAFLTDSSDGDNNSEKNAGRVTEGGLKSEYKAMIESVDQYGGFYVGRYETSLTGESKAQSKKGETSMTAETTSGNTWWGMYEKEKNYANGSGISSVGSSMIWGSQYDAMLNWILKGSDKEKVTKESTSEDVMNKIYDLGNNLAEWTLEAHKTYGRVVRGFNYNYEIDAPSVRFGFESPMYKDGDYGSRLTLYIK